MFPGVSSGFAVSGAAGDPELSRGAHHEVVAVAYVLRAAVEERVQRGEIGRVDAVFDGAADADERAVRVQPGALGQRGAHFELFGALVLDGEPGRGQQRAPVGSQVGHLFGVERAERLAAAAFQPWPVRYGVVGQEARHPVQVGDGQDPAGPQPGEDGVERRGGIVQVVQGGRGPDEVHVGDARQTRPGVGFQRLYARAELPVGGGTGQLLQHGGVAVDGGHPGGGEPLQQGEGTGAAAGTQVHDVPYVVPGAFGDAAQHGVEVGREQLGVEIEDFGQTAVLRIRAVGVAAVGVVTVRVGVTAVTVLGRVRLGLRVGAVGCGFGVRHGFDGTCTLPIRHKVLLMTQDASDLDSLARKRIRALRAAHGWSLDDLASRAHLGPSTLSRIETGHRRIALDQLTAIARALGTSLDQLVETDVDDVVYNATYDPGREMSMWALRGEPGVTVARMRVTEPPPEGPTALKAHPGREWFTVLSGTAELLLGERRLRVERGQAAEFPTMLPHAVGAAGGRPADLLGIFDREGRRSHLREGG